ncbi:MAG: hypothetical protein II045_00195 [Oscillospiraceae bacterium]|nr:hypothetical protein [Oscillospiraceae bacterium]MBQ2323380.1 hypothetical protein [Oscillospiraceae bacterium]
MEENKNIKAADAASVEKALNEKVGVKIDPAAMTGANIAKFLILAAIGIWLFFITTDFGTIKGVPAVALSTTVRNLIKPYINYIVTVICVFLAVTFTIGKISKDSWCGRFMAKDGWLNGILYYIALIICIMVITNKGPAQFLDPEVGPEAVYLAGTCMCTIFFCGWLVNMLTEFGLLEFVAVLITPLMRRLFRLPGQSAIDAMSSFVAAPAAGVFITNKLYNEKVYTNKEASCIMTNFSVVSLGLQALICSIAGHDEWYGKMVLTSLLMAFVMAAIVIRIWPLSKKPDTYIDGSLQTPEMRAPGHYDKDTLKRAFQAGVTRARDGKLSIMLTSIPDLGSFVLKIVGFIAGLAAVVLWLGYYTPVFDWLGVVMTPYLKLCQVPDASVVAPATLVGITEVLMPVLVIAGKEISEVAIFFVCLLSTVQIIFFDESANAMMMTDVDWKGWELVLIFLIRTVIAIPFCSLIAHLLFG